MKWRWYIPVFLIALAFFGVSMEQSTSPNQEIVVQFNTNSVSEAEAKRAVSRITFQLKSIGVKDFQVSEIQNGKLKLTYYSAKDIATIKNLFDAQGEFQQGDTAFDDTDNSSGLPLKEGTNTYKVAVVKIQKDSNLDLGLQGLPVAVKSVKDQYVYPIVSLDASEANFNLKMGMERVAYKNYRNASLLIDSSSHIIPEVRAGPLS